MSEDVFWKQTPRKMKIYFDADKEKQKRKEQEMWMMGLYIKSALQSTVLAAGLFDPKKLGQLPKYPSMPYSDNGVEEELSQEQIDEETQKYVNYINSFKRGTDND